MFTWNLQYISKTRLSDTLKQLRLDTGKGDILIRIHTAIHTADEAVDLAAFIKKIVPGAHIIGSSTCAVIHEGWLHPDQCLVSVSQTSDAQITSLRRSLPAPGEDPKAEAAVLCREISRELVKSDKAVMLTFFTRGYLGVKYFTDASNEIMPGVPMIGGMAGGVLLSGNGLDQTGFVFDETGWTDKGVIAACINGEGVDSVSSVVTGVQVVGEERVISKADKNIILGINGEPAPERYRSMVGDKIKDNPELAYLFPLVYPDHHDVPFMFGYTEKGLITGHYMETGKKLKRGFIYDRKIIADNRSAFNRIETFDKAETLFAYSCRDRFREYPNSVMWELSLYENSNISGCLLEGEIGCIDGMNVFTNCSLVLTALGEGDFFQQYNPYVFSNTRTLEEDNNRLIGYLMDIENEYGSESSMTAGLRDFIRSCELKLLYTEKDSILNEAALNMDIKLNGYDRVCLIEVLDTRRMRMVFTEQRIEATYNNFISKCSVFVSEKDYRLYMIDEWKAVIAAPSYMVSLGSFTEDMKQLQKQLFETSEKFIAIVPVFLVINGCTVDNISSVSDSARHEMRHKNIQFHVCDGSSEEIDEESIRERYHMVNVINFALTHDKVIPYFQGIYDNRTGTIHHYESLIRLEDENGVIYYPGSFLDVARSFGLLYDALSRTMVGKVFEKFKDSPDKSVSINLGMRDIKNPEMTDFIYGFLATAKYPGSFTFEILENEDVDDYEQLVRFVDSVHKLGAYISIDDFGSGYSNLQHLASIHSDYIKIDGSIVRNCCRNDESEKLVALVAGWKKLSNREVKIVAEYVENEDIQRLIQKYDIDFSQGYLFSIPSPEFSDEHQV